MDAKLSSNVGARVVSAVTAEAARLIRQIAPAGDGENIKSRISLAAQRLRWKWTRARAVWNADDRIRVRAEELDQLRTATARRKQEAQNELRELRATLARVAERLERIDPDFHGPDADAVRHQIRSLGPLDIPGDRR